MGAEQMSQRELEERYVDPAVLAEAEGGRKAKKARNKLREEVEPQRRRAEAEEEIQGYYDDLADLRERALALKPVNMSSEELESLKDELVLIESDTYRSLWVFTKREDKLPEAEIKWFKRRNWCNSKRNKRHQRQSGGVNYLLSSNRRIATNE